MDRRFFFKYIKQQLKDTVAVYLSESSSIKDAKALIDPILCHQKEDSKCQLCISSCSNKKALYSSGLGFPMLKIDQCDGCNDCVKVCPVQAISIVEHKDHPFSRRSRET
ncbi:4Fe-4S binding protein [bacterium]|nr:4Fe-4S binding protein [bacterium]